MKSKRPQAEAEGLGYADFFDTRAKIQIMNLAEPRSTDIICDLGAGDCSFLIFAVENYGLSGGIGFEENKSRLRSARKNIRVSGLNSKIEVVPGLMEESASKLERANVILDMLPESFDRFKTFFKQGIKAGSRLIRLDLPLLGFIPDKKDGPFYRHTFPLKPAHTSREWARAVLGRESVTICDLWDEIYFYQFNRKYNIEDIRDFKKILNARLSGFHR